MNISKISPAVKTNNFKSISNSQNPFKYNTNFDSVSFNGKKEKRNRNRLMAYLASGALLLTSLLSPTKASASSFEKRIQDYANLTQTAITEIADDNNFQLAQTLDAPSLTFDLTENWDAKVIKPITSLAYMTRDIETGNDFSNIDDLIEFLYEHKITDEYDKNLAALSIVQANPWMAEKVTGGLVDFTQGDMSNIDPELIRATDYTTDGEKIKILVPEFNPTRETYADTDSKMVSNLTLMPKNANELNEATITFSQEELNSVTSNEDLIQLVNNKLADMYNLETMECYAGDAIWHALGLTKQNEDVFKYASEVNQKNALTSYVKYNGKLQIVCPEVPVSIITNENQGYIDANSFLTTRRDEAPIISYISADRTVANLEDLNGIETTPLDILDLYGLTDDFSLKEAYLQDPEKYEALLTSGYRQIIDSNNELLEIYGDKVITKEDLQSSIGYSLYESGITKINLQPLAYAHVNYTPNYIVIGPTAEPTPSPTAEPTPSPTAEPTPSPTAEPTPSPTAEPTPSPTAEPTPSPTAEPTPSPTAEPTPSPTAEPTPSPTPGYTLPPINPTDEPIITEPPFATPEPTPSQTPNPTNEPTAEPTPTQTAEPTPSPTPGYTLPPINPTDEPIITEPPFATPEPTPSQTPNPTNEPTAEPTPTQTIKPTPNPTNEPTTEPTTEPTNEPTTEPTNKPTNEPTTKPTNEPTPAPTYCPDVDTDGSTDDNDGDTDDGGADFEDSTKPTAEPTARPTVEPTPKPTICPDTDTDDSSDDNDGNTDDGGAEFQTLSLNKKRTFGETFMSLPVIRIFNKKRKKM